MNHNNFNDFVSKEFSESKFSATIGETGGYLTLTNSGQRGGKKSFTLSLQSILITLENIKDNLAEFKKSSKYEESEWRDLAEDFYSDEAAKALASVQTKPLFSTMSKIILWANKSDINPDNDILLEKTAISKAIKQVRDIIQEFTPNDFNKSYSYLTHIPFKAKNFITATKKSALLFSDHLIYQFIASQLTKPFTILTGLSGSGKTKLVEAFAMWLTNDTSILHAFKKGDFVKASRSEYETLDIGKLGILINQSNSKTLLPLKLIEKWMKVIVEHHFDKSTLSQIIQHAVEDDDLEFSKTLNSFHSPLKAYAFEYLEFLNKNQASDTNKNNQYCMIAVGADWTNREPLLGFPNALETGKYIKPDNDALDLIIRAEKDQTKPYFLILDEMNMSHVERYFADFLSAMESTDRTISLHPDDDNWKDCDVPATLTLPKNLFIIGTVNIDETTYMFSPKVLDRANVIEFRVSESEMESYFDNVKELDMESLRGEGASMGESFVEKAKEKNLMAENMQKKLMPFFNKLQDAGAEFGYRTASEISRFVKICTDLADGAMSEEDVIDAAIMQKLLPKVHGSRNKIEKILKKLGKLCLKEEKEAFSKEITKDDIKYKLSYEKLERMHKRVISDGFTSYAEA